MEDKIKIHLPKYVYDTLIKDCEAFEFYKNDKVTLNKNAFLIRLINNYYLTYQAKEDELISLISTSLKNSNIENNDLTNDIVSKINRLNVSPNKEKVSSIISLKPTKESVASLSYIENYLLRDISVSEFFRNLFSSYADLPQDQRERIIFKNQYDTILKAIKKNKKIFFTTEGMGEVKHEAHPYALSSSKEELHYYLLAKYNDNIRTYRLSRITSVTIINEPAEFSNEDVELLEKMLKYGPQFTYEKDEQLVIIKLSERGKEMYKTHYTHRPIADIIDGDFYTFSCSHSQIYSYFRRFGKDAFVITPKELQLKLYRFHKQACEHYSKNTMKKIH